MNFRDVLLWIAYLATVFKSRRDPQFRQDIGLKQNPYANDYDKPPYTHLFLLLPCPLHEIGPSHKFRIENTPVTAHGCEDYPAQENPLGDGEQADDPPLPHENEDISLHVSPSPQEGQITLSSSSEDRINFSKVLSHLLHLNSYRGIFPLHSINAHRFIRAKQSSFSMNASHIQ